MASSSKTDRFCSACRALSLSEQVTTRLIQNAKVLNIDLDDPVATILLIEGLIQKGLDTNLQFAKNLPGMVSSSVREAAVESARIGERPLPRRCCLKCAKMRHTNMRGSLSALRA